MLYAIVAVLVIIVDQWVKYWVAGAISLESTGETFIPGIISLVNLHNDGAAFSFLSGGGARIYFIILTGVFTVAVILALATRFISGRVARWSIVLVTAGGLSNCIDRVIYGYVQDMFKLELFNFPVFNVADIFITVFCLIFVFAIIFERDKKPQYEDELEDDEEEDRPVRRREREKAEKPERAKRAERTEPAGKPEKTARKSRKPKYEDEYAQYKAARATRQQQAASTAPAARSKSGYDPADPFAEWERANARVEAQQKGGYTKPAGTAAPQYSAPKAPVQQAARQPMQQPAAQYVPPTQQPAAQPVQPQQPARAPVQQTQQPAPQKSAAKPADAKTDFSLDDILNEFK